MSSDKIKHTIKEFGAPAELYETLCSDIFATLTNPVSIEKPFSIILSGGRSPVKLHSFMVDRTYHSAMDWNNVFFFFSDERCVQPDDELSNYAMAEQTLFIPLKIKKKNIFRIKGELSPDEAAVTYHRQIKDFFQGEPCFDLALLGMGTDGHTASLFPQSRALNIQDRFAVSTGPGPEGSHRVSLTYRSLNASKRAWVMVIGIDKKKTLDKAFDALSHFRNFPVKAIQPLEELIFYVSP